MNSHYKHSPLLDTAYVLKGNTLIHYDDDNVTEVDVNKMNTNYVQRNVTLLLYITSQVPVYYIRNNYKNKNLCI